MPTRNIKFLDAAKSDLQAEFDEGYAALHFLTEQEGPVVVSLRKSELERLHAQISDALARE